MDKIVKTSYFWDIKISRFFSLIKESSDIKITAYQQ